MVKIKDVIGIDRRLIQSGLYGVEIEVEGTSLPTYEHLSSKVWRAEGDGSLRAEEAWEYVMPKPGSLQEVRESLDYLDAAYDSLDSDVHDSVRAGVHVHMKDRKSVV